MNEVRRALEKGWPVLAALAPLSLVLGAQAAQRGLSVAEITLMTALNYAGGSEFAAVGLWSEPPRVALIVGMTFLINSRHLLMGAALAPHIRHVPRCIALPALFVMVDESWAFSLADAREAGETGAEPAFSLPFFLTLGLMFWVAWFCFAALGATIGPTLGDLRRWGFGMALPAIFLVLVRGRWTTLRAARPWSVSLAAAAATHLAVPGPWYVLAGAVAGLFAAWYWAGRP